MSRNGCGRTCNETTWAEKSMADEPLLVPSPRLAPTPAPPLPRGALAAALINTLKSVLGTGLLAMPWAFLQLRDHLSTAVVMCGLLGVWSCYTMLLLYKCVVLAWPVTGGYGTLVLAALGSSGGVLCAANLVLHQVLCTASYLVFIGENLQDVFGGSSAAFVAAAAPPIVLLCWLRDLRALGPASAVGTAALLLALCLVVHEGCSMSAGAPLLDGETVGATAGRALRMRHVVSTGHHAHATGGVSPLPAAAATGAATAPPLAALGAFAGITTFTFCGHSEVVTVVLSFGASHPRHAPYGRVVFAMACVAIPAVLAFAMSSMACFGDTVQKNILLSVHSRAAALLKLLCAAAVLCTCPLKMFPAFEVLETALGLDSRSSSEADVKSAVDPASADDESGARADANAGAAAERDGDHDVEHDSETAVKATEREGLVRSPDRRRRGDALGGAKEVAPRGLGGWRIALRTLLVLLAVVLALACPDFEFFVAFIGAFCNALICFVLPPLMYIALVRASLKKASLTGGTLASLSAHAILAALGLVVLVVGTWSVVSDKLMQMKA